MKQLKWLAGSAALLAAVLAIEGWPAYQGLAHNREWKAITAAPEGTELQGLKVKIHTQVAAIAAQRPERAAMLVRLEIQGTQAAGQDWGMCKVSLRNASDEVWMPLTSATTDGVIKALSPDHKNAGPCKPYMAENTEGEQTWYADQLFMLPSSALQGLRLYVSGQGTRPQALAFTLQPEVKHLQ